MKTGLIEDEHGVARCWWCGDDPLYISYHDDEWGHPVTDDTRLFEKMCLEGFQAGLSWITILRKRENFRNAFAGFDMQRIACFTQKDVERLLRDEGIIRHRGKIEAAINNAQHAMKLVEEKGSLASYLWNFEPAPANRPERFDYGTLSQLAQTPESKALSKDLKKRGFKFVGPTTMYALMQAMGMVNDHLEGCFMREAVERKREALARP